MENGISPGLVETPLSEFLWKNENSRKISENMHPLGRLGKPEDIANGVIFLLDEKNNWITGQIISIDGGLSIGRSSKI
jgi:NAD(P)-dependent dehydrogenase (short-subunit alcohol dehydrogenase family)